MSTFHGPWRRAYLSYISLYHFQVVDTDRKMYLYLSFYNTESQSAIHNIKKRV